MSSINCRIVPCLWFDSQAEEAAEFYTSIFPDGKINAISRYGDAGREFHGREPGAVMTVAFEVNGQPMTALNGGPMFTFNEAISLQVVCDSQSEIDHFWEKLSAGGDANAQRCGWLKDRYGVSWQVLPARLEEMMQCGDPQMTDRVMSAVLTMRKIELASLEKAFGGTA